MNTRRRLWAIGFIILGITLIVGKWMNFFTIVALILLVYGVYKIRRGEDVKTGYLLLGIGSGVILLNHLGLVIGIVLISLLIFYMKVKRSSQVSSITQKHQFLSSLHLDRDPWVLRSMGNWHVLGDVDVDLSLAIVEEHENILMFQGILGDLDLMITEDYGIEIDAFVLLGRIELGSQSETGFKNRIIWRSPNYDEAQKRVKIITSYMLGDVSIRLIY